MSGFYIGTDMRHNVAVLQRVMVEQDIDTVRLVPSRTGEPIAISLGARPGHVYQSVKVEVHVQHPAFGELSHVMSFEDAAASVLVAMLQIHTEAKVLVVQEAAHLVLPAHGPVTLVDAGSALPTMSGWRARTLN